MALQWDDLDFDTGVVAVNKGPRGKRTAPAKRPQIGAAAGCGWGAAGIPDL